MAEEKKDAYGMITNAFALSGLSNEQVKQHFPKIDAWFHSASTAEDRRKRLDMLLGDPEVQKELRQFDDFKKFDFSGYKEPSEEAYKPGNLATASMKDVKNFYDRAKRTIDPKGRLGKTELYETAGDPTFQQLEEKIGPDYEGDWFGNLLEEFGYPDTPEGYEQLTQDFNAALTRTKNANFADKYGSGKAPLKFLFKNTFNVLEDGKKPTVGDVAVDAGTNAAMTIPAAKMFPMLGAALRVGPKGVQAAEFAAKADAPRTILGKVGKSVATAAAVPTASQAADYAFGTDTEKEKKEGLLGRAVSAGSGTFVNMAAPGLLYMLPGRALAMTGNAGLRGKDAETVRQSIGEIIFNGGRANAAKERLAGLADDLADKKDVVLEFAKRLSGKKNASAEELAGIAAGFGRRLEQPALNLAKSIQGQGGNVGAGIRDFMAAGRDDVQKLFLEQMAAQPATVLESMLPYLSAYGVNRAGTGKVADYGKRMLGRYTNRFVEDDEEE